MKEVTQQEKREAIYTALRIEFPISTDFFLDLNACNAAELELSDEQHALFRKALRKIIRQLSLPYDADDKRAYISATAAQRAEAIYQAITQPK